MILRLAFLAPFLITLSVRAAEPEEALAQLETAKAALKEHYEYQKLIAKERGDWEIGKELLESRVALVKDQIAEFREKTAEQASKITDADEERTKLSTEDEELTTLQEAQLSHLLQLEDGVRALLPVLPEALSSKLQALTERLPDPAKKQEEIKTSLGERYQNAVGVLNEINKFHNDLTVVNERRVISGGRQAEVQTIYFGLSLAFYAGIGESASEAGRGVPGKKEWVWSPMPGEAERIAKMIAMVEKSSSAEYVPLPVTIE
jgi:hypothetical protein